jgi:pSer/pThr/pTyr-binding forkhead associated (FHA) protein
VTVAGPFARHAASPAELKQQFEANRAGRPYLLFRDGGGDQCILPLPDTREPISMGRGPSCDVSLPWDEKVSRVHAQMERIGDDWTISDDGLSRNGTFVNGDRLTRRRRLFDGDLVRVGSTEMAYRAPAQSLSPTVSGRSMVPPTLSDAQRRVLVALCRPFHDAGAYATPATNKEIADELVLSVVAVKTHLRALFQRFGIDELAQNTKRARLVELAFESGAVTPADFTPRSG